jgi:hypothetical protein
VLASDVNEKKMFLGLSTGTVVNFSLSMLIGESQTIWCARLKVTAKQKSMAPNSAKFEVSEDETVPVIEIQYKADFHFVASRRQKYPDGIKRIQSFISFV